MDQGNQVIIDCAFATVDMHPVDGAAIVLGADHILRFVEIGIEALDRKWFGKLGPPVFRLSSPETASIASRMISPSSRRGLNRQKNSVLAVDRRYLLVEMMPADRSRKA